MSEAMGLTITKRSQESKLVVTELVTMLGSVLYSPIKNPYKHIS